MRDLTDSDRLILQSIIEAPRAWMSLADLQASGHTVEQITGLEAEPAPYGHPGWLVRWDTSMWRNPKPRRRIAWPMRWDLPQGGAVVSLTPWAADQLKVVVVEHWEFDVLEEKHYNGERRPERRVKVKVAEAVPEFEYEGKRIRARVTNAVPKLSREQPIGFREVLIPDTAPGPVYLAAVNMGEDPDAPDADDAGDGDGTGTTRDERRAVRLFESDGTAGIPVEMDRRRKGKKPA